MAALFPRILEMVEKNDLEQIVVAIRKSFGRDQIYAPILDMVSLLEVLGIDVISRETANPTLCAKDDGKRIQIAIIVNKNMYNAAEYRFILAYFLGHIILDIQPKMARGEWKVAGFSEQNSPLERYVLGKTGNKVDLAADRFAATLLLPKGLLKRAYEKIKDEQQLADFFGVHSKCLDRRLEEVGEKVGDPINFQDAEEKMQKQTNSENSKPQSQPKSQSPTKSSKSAGKKVGMERIREIARMLDRS